MPALGSLELDPATRRLVRDGEEIHLRPKAFALLALLIEAAPRIVPKREIHDRLWPRGVVSDATLVALVKELRRALKDRDRRAPIVRTVHRIGYALDATVHAPASPLSHWLVANGRERFALAAGDNVIGRDPQASVWLDYATISRRHARIRVSGERALVEDLGSKNGTSVAGQKIDARTTLRDGDRVAFGRVVLTYRHSEAERPTLTEVSRLTAAETRT